MYYLYSIEGMKVVAVHVTAKLYFFLIFQLRKCIFLRKKAYKVLFVRIIVNKWWFHAQDEAFVI